MTLKKATFAYPSQNWLTETAAKIQAAGIREYWARRGYDVQTEIVAAFKGHPSYHDMFTIRSDMVGGLPVRRLVAVAA